MPWLTPQANGLLTTLLRPTDLGLEFGSGRSTLWLAARVSHLTSVENDERWYANISRQLKAQGRDNVDYLFAARDLPPEQGGESEYVCVAARFADRSLDFALVDGIYRDHCARLAIEKIKSGGLLIVDNVNWFLPSDSRSPGSRKPTQGADGPVWAETLEALREWRWIWTSSGVWDTAIFLRP